MDEARIDRIIKERGGGPASLVQVMLDIQHEERWLSKEVLEMVSDKLCVPLSQVHRTATFYKAFKLGPPAQHEVHVCNGTSCHVRGAPKITQAVEQALGVRSGEPDPNGKFNVETTNCLGCCGAGPVMVVDGKFIDNVAPDKAKDMLKNL